MSRRRIALRTGGPNGLSGRLDLRVAAVLGAMAVAMLAAATVSIAQGEYPLPFGDVLTTLVGLGDGGSDFIVWELRLPRALCAVLAGAALGIAGAIFQDLARNPLVSPDIIGVEAGAALAGVALAVFTDASGLFAVPAAALVGAIVTGLVLYGLAWRGGVHGYRLVLIGIGVAALLNAGISYVLTRGRIFEVSDAYIWLVGSLNDAGWNQIWPLAGALIVLVPAAFLLARQMGAMQLGDDVARALGARVESGRLAMFAVAVLLTGFAVSAVGAVGFVAFIAPHLARRITHSVAPTDVLAAAAAAGALLVLAADLVGRLAFPPSGIPVGIVTAIIAAPYFLYLLARANRIGAVG